MVVGGLEQCAAEVGQQGRVGCAGRESTASAPGSTGTCQARPPAAVRSRRTVVPRRRSVSITPRARRIRQASLTVLALTPSSVARPRTVGSGVSAESGAWRTCRAIDIAISSAVLPSMMAASSALLGPAVSVINLCIEQTRPCTQSKIGPELGDGNHRCRRPVGRCCAARALSRVAAVVREADVRRADLDRPRRRQCRLHGRGRPVSRLLRRRAHHDDRAQPPEGHRCRPGAGGEGDALLHAVSQRADDRARRTHLSPVGHPRRPGLLHRLGLGGQRHRASACHQLPQEQSGAGDAQQLPRAFVHHPGHYVAQFVVVDLDLGARCELRAGRLPPLAARSAISTTPPSPRPVSTTSPRCSTWCRPAMSPV